MLSHEHLFNERVMNLPTVYVRGHEGSYFVDAESFGKLPTAHAHLFKGVWYEHPGPAHYGRTSTRDLNQWKAQCEATAKGCLIVMTRDDTTKATWERKGYIGVFRVDNVDYANGTLRFRMIERVANTQ